MSATNSTNGAIAGLRHGRHNAPNFYARRGRFVDVGESLPVPAEWASRAWIDWVKYQEMYKRSITDPDGFWGEMGKRIDWIKPYTKVKNTSFDPHNVSIKWFEDGTSTSATTASTGTLRSVATRWRSSGRAMIRRSTRRSPIASCTSGSASLPNVLKANGVKKGDRVTIYLPMIPEAAYAMLACARIGAIHSVVFGGFSPDSLAGRIIDAEFRNLSLRPTKGCAVVASCH